MGSELSACIKSGAYKLLIKHIIVFTLIDSYTCILMISDCRIIELHFSSLQQLEESSHELSNKDDEIAKIQLQLQGVTNRLDEVEEEYQMLKLSVKRKEEELVTALDKNL